MVKLYYTNNSNYDINTLDKDDIVLDKKENIIVINNQKYSFMTISDEIENGDSSTAISQKGVKNYIVDTEETYTNTVLALKEENTKILAALGELTNRIANLESKIK